MVTELSERPEEQLRQFLVDNLRSGEIEGYDPNQTDQTATDFLPVTSDWSFRGDYYPIIVVRESSGPSLPDSGETGYNRITPDGSGPGQYAIYNVTVSCQAVQGPDGAGGPYRNSTSAKDLVFELYREVHHQIQTNANSATTDAGFVGLTPPTVTRSTEETDSGSTITWIQRQGTAFMGVHNDP